MKSILLSTFLIHGILILLLACPVGQVIDHGKLEYGTLEILISRSNSRTNLSPEESKFLANSYELMIFDTSNFFVSHTINDEPLILSLEPGQYQLVVLAGVKRSAAAVTSILVGSGYSPQEVTIVSGERTSIAIGLIPIYLSLDSPEEGIWGNSYLVRVKGKTFNPHVGMTLYGATPSLRPRLKSNALWDGYKEFDLVTGDENDWVSDYGLLVTPGIESFDVQFFGSLVTIKDKNHQNKNLSGITNFTWKWPNPLDLSDDSPLVQRIEKTGAGLLPPTGIELIIEWN